jgi:aspartate/methionine/tyrosine aminotransferase
LPQPISVLNNCQIEKNPIIITNSFSKNYFMPFYRSGYLIANKSLIKKAKKIIEFSNFKITPRAIAASFAAISGSQKWRDALSKKIYEKGRY